MKYRVDASERTYLAVCTCGARFLALTRLQSLVRLAHHEREYHPADKHARAGLANHNRRAASLT